MADPLSKGSVIARALKTRIEFYRSRAAEAEGRCASLLLHLRECCEVLDDLAKESGGDGDWLRDVANDARRTMREVLDA